MSDSLKYTEQAPNNLILEDYSKKIKNDNVTDFYNVMSKSKKSKREIFH